MYTAAEARQLELAEASLLEVLNGNPQVNLAIELAKIPAFDARRSEDPFGDRLRGPNTPHANMIKAFREAFTKNFNESIETSVLPFVDAVGEAYANLSLPEEDRVGHSDASNYIYQKAS